MWAYTRVRGNASRCTFAHHTPKFDTVPAKVDRVRSAGPRGIRDRASLRSRDCEEVGPVLSEDLLVARTVMVLLLAVGESL